MRFVFIYFTITEVKKIVKKTVRYRGSLHRRSTVVSLVGVTGKESCGVAWLKRGVQLNRVLVVTFNSALACSKRSDSGERCAVKKAMKSRGGRSSSLAFIFSRSFLLRTAPHYLNTWNRLTQHKTSNPILADSFITQRMTDFRIMT